ncbi:cell wall-active antibiotics response protein LiaF [Paenibacillus sp. LHD-117]|uniref:cell wall-active antibiotics response protein LiaF n=1 Tax=Paenibacillus sp. LHD-117 TaxID=3071412 RepID=UPI0027E1C2B4|nr:cell wall-active antibiotics response protein LiaF [Paenibacillus sp. LHD-117]MDQ6419918.1 cell wall-active antibiotics response protein LiaF [Paenibacillus sp. LHD-117]
MNGNFAGRLFTGLIVITVGLFFLLRQLGVSPFESISIGELFSTYWPCILMYFGVAQLLSGRFHGGSGWWGAVMLLIGFVFLGNNLEWFTWSIGDIVPFLIPIVIIIVGLRMIWKPSKPQHKAPPADEWKSYRPYDKESADVPPAPPLHPDPTAPGGGEDAYKRVDGTDPNYESGHIGNEEDEDDDHDGRMHANKQRRKKGGSDHGRGGHVEWWNHNDPKVMNRSGFIGDIHMGQDYWELKPLNISHFIGDTVLDLTKAEIPYGETKVNISSFIGDVKIYVPNDYDLGIQVVSSAFIGDVKVLGQKEGGLFTNVNTTSPRYSDSDKKIKLIVSTFIGDTRVIKVG